MLTNDIILTVRYAETDQMGIVHHSNYPIWYEASRTAFIRKLGLPYSKVEEMGVMLPLIELKCNYKGVAKYEDEVIIKTLVREMTGARITFGYEVYKKENNGNLLINTGETMHAWTSTELKPVNLKKFRPEIFDILSTAINT